MILRGRPRAVFAALVQGLVCGGALTITGCDGCGAPGPTRTAGGGGRGGTDAGVLSGGRGGWAGSFGGGAAGAGSSGGDPRHGGGNAGDGGAGGGGGQGGGAAGPGGRGGRQGGGGGGRGPGQGGAGPSGGGGDAGQGDAGQGDAGQGGAGQGDAQGGAGQGGGGAEQGALAGSGGGAGDGGREGGAAGFAGGAPSGATSLPCSASGETTLDLSVDDVMRQAILRRPTTVPCDKRAPVVIWLHGSTTVAISPDPARFAIRVTGLGKQAENQRYLTVYPRSGRVQNDKVWAWNAGGGTNDVRFLTALVERLVKHENVDPRRVFLAGHSSGAFLTYWMACQHAGLFAGYAAFSGAVRSEWRCYPSYPINFLEVHGRDDTAVPFEGNERFTATMETMVHLRDNLGCEQKSSHSESEARHDDTWACRNNSVLKLVTLPRAGHDAPLGLVRSDLWSFFTQQNRKK